MRCIDVIFLHQRGYPRQLAQLFIILYFIMQWTIQGKTLQLK